MNWLRILHIVLLLVISGAFFILVRRLAGTPLKGLGMVAAGLGLSVLHLLFHSLYHGKFFRDAWVKQGFWLIDNATDYVTQTLALILLLVGAYQLVSSILPHLSEYYSSLVEHSLVGVYLIQDGVFKFVNPHLAEIFGYQRKELIGKPALDLVAPESRATVAENIRKRIDGEKEVIHYEFTGLKKNGERFDVEVHGSRTMYRGKLGVHGSLLDISERKRAEEALRASESKYRQLVEQSSDAVFLADKDGNIRFVNSRGCEMLGYSLEELQRMNIKETYPPEETTLALERMKQPLLGKLLRFERRMRRKAGSYLPVEVSLKWIPEGLFQGIVRDITERKQAEEAVRASEDRFRRLSENAQDIIYRYRLLPTRGFEYVSPAATAITGYTPEEHYADPDLGFKIVHPDDRRQLERLVSGDGALSQPVTLRWMRKDGKIISVEQRNVPIHDEAGKLVAIEGIARDITEQRKAEEVLREREERFRVLIENSSDAIALLRADMTISYASPSAINVLGYAPEELLGTSPFERIHPEDVKRAKSLLSELLQNPGKKLTLHARLRHNGYNGQKVLLFLLLT